MNLGRSRHEPRDENIPCDQVDAAVREDRAALAAAGHRPERRIPALANLATSLYCAYRCQARLDQPEQLLEAIGHLTEARDLAAGDATRFGGTTRGLAAAEAVRDIEGNISVFRTYLPGSSGTSGPASVPGAGGGSQREQLERAYRRSGAGDEERGLAVLQLGTLDHSEWEASNDNALLTRAIERCREAARLLANSSDGRLPLVARCNLANALLSSYTRVSDDERHLTEAHDIIRELDASGLGDDVPGYSAVRSHVLGQIALVRHQRTGDTGALPEAEDLLRRQSADRGPLHGIIGDRARSVEAVLAEIRLHRGGRLQAGDEAVDLLRNDGAASTDPAFLLNQSFALFRRHQARGGADDPASQDLYDAATLASRAIDLAGDGPVRAHALRMSAHCLMDLARLRPRSAGPLWEKALEEITEALARGTFNEREAPLAGTTQAQCRAGLAALRRDPSGLEAAAAQLAELEGRLPADSANRPALLAELFRIRLAKAEISGAPEDDETATRAAKRACDAAAEFSPAVEYSTARAWGDRAWRRGALLEAAEAYRHGLSALHHLSRVQVTRGDKTSVLSSAEGMGARAAYAFAESGMLGRAVVAVESGRALMLTEALERRAADLDRLRRADRSDLADAFRDAATEVARSDAELLGGWSGGTGTQPGTQPGEGTGTDATRAARVRDRFDAVVAEIREAAGLASFLPPPSYGELALTVRESGTHVVYLLATDRGGLALSLPATENARPFRIPLPSLTTSVLDGLVGDWRDALDTRDEAEREDKCDAVADRLWTGVMAPVMRRLRGVPKVSLIAVGGLGLLPLHAARRPDTTAPTGHRHVIDDLAVSYQANVRALGAAHTIRSLTGRHHTLLTVTEPTPVSYTPLPSAKWQIHLARRHFRSGTGASLGGPEATREAVLAALPHASVQHFACHGEVVDGSPLDGGLVMSQDRLLTVRDVLRLDALDVRMAVLPACRTGALDQAVLDEAAGMPSAFLQSGYAGVMATGWDADGWVCALITDRFYAHWLGEGMEPEQALRQAQIWVRDSTNAQKHAAYPQIAELAPEPGEASGPWASARADAGVLGWAVLSFHGC
ncbi:CHAT domain-containing protein [Streptomyces sp. NPDC057137]|uniref:CHAT domain-containing protein n=1 Tax=Streptomyces sp. NPDC057137 TaxID=3346030 RepID=UPI00363A3336